MSGYLRRQYLPRMPVFTHIIGTFMQSNKEASNTITSAAQTPDDRIWMLGKDFQFRRAYEPIHDRTNQGTLWPATTQQGGGGTSHSSVLKMCKDILAADPTFRPLIVPGAVGGTSPTNWAPGSNRRDPKSLYGNLCLRIDMALAMQPGTPVVLCSHGHEATVGTTSENLTTGVLNTAYRTEIYNELMEFRTDYPTCKFILNQIATINAESASYRMAQESLRQLESLISDLILVVTLDVKRNSNPDDIHVSEDGQIVIGGREALAFRKLVLGHSVNAGPRVSSITRTSGTVLTLDIDQEIQANASNWGDHLRAYADGSELTITTAVRDGVDTSKINMTSSTDFSAATKVVVTYGQRAAPNNAVRTNMILDNDGLPLPGFGPWIAT